MVIAKYKHKRYIKFASLNKLGPNPHSKRASHVVMPTVLWLMTSHISMDRTPTNKTYLQNSFVHFISQTQIHKSKLEKKKKYFWHQTCVKYVLTSIIMTRTRLDSHAFRQCNIKNSGNRERERESAWRENYQIIH